MNDRLKYGLGGLVVGGFGVWFVMMTVVNTESADMMRMMGIGNTLSQRTPTQTSLDSHFIEQMIPHHEDAIAMSTLALEKALRPEVKTLAQNIIDSQTKENIQMKAWYKEWFGRDVPTGTVGMSGHGMMGGSEMHMGDSTDLERLKEAEDFDREFVEQMIPHHQMAVMMATMLRNSTQRTEMKNLAEDIIEAQQKEISLMKKWLKEWGE